MDILKEKLTETMSRISTERDIVTSAKIKAEAEAVHKKSLPKFKMSVPIVVCSLILVCGLTVSAANFGWVHGFFGDSAALIEQNIDDYSVKIGNVKIENAEDVPYKFTMGDVITDGETLYFNLLVEDMPAERDWHGDWGSAGSAFPPDGSECRSSWHSSSWDIIGKTENTVNTAVFAKFTNKIKKGDVFEFRFEDDSRRQNPLNHIDEAENKRALLATLSFEIQSEVNDLQRTIDVNHAVIFKSRPSPAFAEIESYDEEKLTTVEVNIDTVTISPFSFEIKGTADLSQPFGTGIFYPEFGWGNIWFIYKNGDRVCFTPNNCNLEKKEGYQDVLIYGDFSNSHGGAPMGVQDLSEIEAIEFDGFTVPLNTNENGK